MAQERAIFASITAQRRQTLASSTGLSFICQNDRFSLILQRGCPSVFGIWSANPAVGSTRMSNTIGSPFASLIVYGEA